MQLRFEPLTGTIGAEVHGIGINAGPSDAAIETVHQGLMKHHVLFFRDQHPSPEALLAFARRFGPISPRHPLNPCVPGLEEVMVIVDDAAKPPENDMWAQRPLGPAQAALRRRASRRRAAGCWW